MAREQSKAADQPHATILCYATDTVRTCSHLRPQTKWLGCAMQPTKSEDIAERVALDFPRNTNPPLQCWKNESVAGPIRVLGRRESATAAGRYTARVAPFCDEGRWNWRQNVWRVGKARGFAAESVARTELLVSTRMRWETIYLTIEILILFDLSVLDTWVHCTDNDGSILVSSQQPVPPIFLAKCLVYISLKSIAGHTV